MARAGSGRSGGGSSGRSSGMHSANNRARGTGSGFSGRPGTNGANKRAGANNSGIRPPHNEFHNMPGSIKRPPEDKRPQKAPIPPAYLRGAYIDPVTLDVREAEAAVKDCHKPQDETDWLKPQQELAWRLHKKKKEQRPDKDICTYFSDLVDLGSALAPFFGALIMVALFVGLIFIAGSGPASSVAREKAETGIAYRTDCIVDELGWFEDIPGTAKNLQSFYDKTGVQPYIYLKAYDSTLYTDAAKLAFAEKWYDENIGNEGTFLYIYFAEKNQDVTVGDMVYVDGDQISSFMDDEAGEIFWHYLDEVWYSDMSTDELFVTVFNNTADRVMTKTTSFGDVFSWILLGAIILAAIIIFGYTVFWVIGDTIDSKLERLDEIDLILNTPLDIMAADAEGSFPADEDEEPEEDPLLRKYLPEE